MMTAQAAYVMLVPAPYSCRQRRRKMRSTLTLVVAVLSFVTPAAALAGANKTWVSGKGADTGTCPVTAPCKSFQYALDQTSAGGEIDVRDAGGYGTVIITKAISIVADGVLASISVPQGGTGITIKAGANDVVILKGLTIDGHGIGLNGILASQALQLIVRDVTVQGLTGVGLAADSVGQLPAVTMSNIVAQNNNIGIRNTGNITTMLKDSNITHNATGLMLRNGLARIDNMTMEHNSVYGLDTNETVYLSGSRLVYDTFTTLDNVYSYGDNIIAESGIGGYLLSASKL